MSQEGLFRPVVLLKRAAWSRFTAMARLASTIAILDGFEGGAMTRRSDATKEP